MNYLASTKLFACTPELLLYGESALIIFNQGMTMRYLLLMLAGATTGLILSGSVGALFGVVAGFAVSALNELTGEENDDVSDTVSESMTHDSFDSQLSTGLGTDSEICNFESDDSFWDTHYINPANGLPMMSGGITGFDVGGNLYGMDSSSEDIESIDFTDDLFNDSSSDPF